jgi:hypothetical protein
VTDQQREEWIGGSLFGAALLWLLWTWLTAGRGNTVVPSLPASTASTAPAPPGIGVPQVGPPKLTDCNCSGACPIQTYTLPSSYSKIVSIANAAAKQIQANGLLTLGNIIGLNTDPDVSITVDYGDQPVTFAGGSYTVT